MCFEALVWSSKQQKNKAHMCVGWIVTNWESYRTRGNVMINVKVKVSTYEQTAAYLFTGKTRGRVCYEFHPLSTSATN